MIIASVSENLDFEKRIAVTPETAKKFIGLGFEVLLPQDYGKHLGINDKEYLDLGVKISNDEKQILREANILIQLGLLSDEKNLLLNKDQILVGAFNPFIKIDEINELKKKI